MQEIIASVDNFKFDVEIAIEQQLGTQPLPFPGMDKSGSAICTFYLSSICNKGGACPFRHVKGDRTVVCKHWLRGLCKKGDDCEFLHEYDMSKMPECYFYSRFAECSNKECLFLHIDPNSKIKDCPWYDRGFCRHGPNCKNRHVRRLLCQCYLNGFCLEGPKCKFMHPKYDLPIIDVTAQAKKAAIVCHYCGESGHKALNCPSLPTGMKSDYERGPSYNREPYRKPERLGYGTVRNLDDVTCFKCGEKGHYANKCTKSHLAFLTNKP